MASTLSDAQLVARCRSGDQAAWNELVERFSRYVYAISVQAFHLGRLRSDEAIRPWIAQLTRRVCIDRLRSGSREAPAVDELPDEGQEDETIAHLDEAMAVREGLDDLGDPCREILDRFFCRDESYRTIGEAMDIPAGTIASRISRCLAKLREALEGKKAGAEPV